MRAAQGHIFNKTANNFSRKRGNDKAHKTGGINPFTPNTSDSARKREVIDYTTNSNNLFVVEPTAITQSKEDQPTAETPFKTNSTQLNTIKRVQPKHHQ